MGLGDIDVETIENVQGKLKILQNCFRQALIFRCKYPVLIQMDLGVQSITSHFISWDCEKLKAREVGDFSCI